MTVLFPNIFIYYGILVIVIATLAWRRIDSYVERAFMSVIIPAGLVFITYAIISAAIPYITKLSPTSESYTTKLAGLSNSSGIRGTFILGSGSVNDVQYVYYNVVKPNGMIYTRKVPMDDIAIKVDSVTYLKTVYKTAEVGFPLTLLIDKHVKSAKPTYIFHLKEDEVNMCNYYDIDRY